METVYSFGYQGYSPDELKAKAEELDAIVVDTRFSPNSRDPRWRKQALVTLLGDRYRHAVEFGNENYRGGPTKLHNPNVGVQKAGQLLLTQPIILMCACWNARECHRSDVAALLRNEFQVEVKLLTRADFPKKVKPKKVDPQQTLF